MKSTGPTRHALTGALPLSALLLLTACATPVPEVRTVEVAVPVIQRVPDNRVGELALPAWPAGQITNGDLERRILQLEELAGRCNADREWLRNRQGGGSDLD